MKVQNAAAKAKVDTKAFCDQGAETFKVGSELALKAEISNDFFVRTTDEQHEDGVRYAWSTLNERAYIYTSKHEGWYSVSDETFYPSSAVHLVIEPTSGRKMMASIETGKEVEWSSEVNYKFRLSELGPKLLEFYESNPQFVIPHYRMRDIVNQVRNGLEDLSISRPTSRLQWGIPVPEDDSQTMYVWLDALLNYATKAGYPWPPAAQNNNTMWPADCHVIGKDIIRFHAIYWPAFLIALEMPLPKTILTHAHWTIGHEKMAKSTGNVVNPFFAMDRFDPDTIRFYLAHDGGISNDANYDNSYISQRYEIELRNNLGGLASRILRTKSWSARKSIEMNAAGELEPWLGTYAKQRDFLGDTLRRVTEHMEKMDASAAVKEALGLVHETNAFLQQAQPWTDDPERLSTIEDAPHRVQRTVFLCAETLRFAAIMLQPFLPNYMATLFEMLGVASDKRTIAHAIVGADADYGQSTIRLGRGEDGALFPSLLVRD
ncbi:MAG: methionyl-tRNA synthetase [Chrysothrix sp. TS-e1954]|nr:MAG: methionyl-tRNA synthetase [Chrysothrix sp. TS-e1954]